MAKLKMLKPLARREKGKISTVYETMSGVKARLGSTLDQVMDKDDRHVLVSGVEQEDERDDGVSRGLGAVKGESRGHGRLQREEHKHTGGRGDEEQATAGAVNHERSEDGPAQVPDGENTVDQELDGRVCDTDRVEDLVEVVRHKTVARPLGEESDGDDDPHALAVASGGEEGLISDVGGDGLIEVNGCLDLLELVLDKRVLIIAVGMIVCKSLECLRVTTLAHEPARGLGREEYEEDLDDRRKTLESRRHTPRPRAGNLEGTERSPSSAAELVSINRQMGDMACTYTMLPEYQRELYREVSAAR